MQFAHLISNIQIQLYSIEHVTIGPWWNYQGVNSPFTRLYYTPQATDTWVEYHGERHQIQPGAFIVTPPYTAVDYFCGDQCDLYGILFTAELVSGIELFTLNGMELQRKADKMVPLLYQRLLDLNPDKGVPIADPFNKTYNEKLRLLSEQEDSFHTHFESDSILRLLVSRFVTNQTPLFSRSDSTINTRILKILEFIDQNIDQPLSLDILAKQVNLNPTYLSNTFTECLKVRPTLYIKRKRLEKAQRLLLSTSYPMKQIAYEVGIPNTDYFFRLFKSQIGCTPSEYRKRYS